MEALISQERRNAEANEAKHAEELQDFERQLEVVKSSEAALDGRLHEALAGQLALEVPKLFCMFGVVGLCIAALLAEHVLPKTARFEWCCSGLISRTSAEPVPTPAAIDLSPCPYFSVAPCARLML